MKLLFCYLLLTWIAPSLLAQNTDTDPSTIWYIDGSNLQSHPSTEERLGQPYWRATLIESGTPEQNALPKADMATFIDNGYEVGELKFSDEFGQATGLMDALWTLHQSSNATSSSALTIYSNGEVIPLTGSLEQGHYELNYTRNGKPLRLILERIVN